MELQINRNLDQTVQESVLSGLQSVGQEVEAIALASPEEFSQDHLNSLTVSIHKLTHLISVWGTYQRSKGVLPQDELIEHKMSLLGVLQGLALAQRQGDLLGCRNLITQDLRDNLTKWMKHISRE